MADLWIEVGGHAAFTDEKKRHAFAVFIAGILAAGAPPASIPYQTSASSQSVYSVDVNNDWWLVFDPDNKRRAALVMRYHDEAVLRALTTWVAYRYGRAKMINTSAEQPRPPIDKAIERLRELLADDRSVLFASEWVSAAWGEEHFGDRTEGEFVSLCSPELVRYMLSASDDHAASR